MKMQTEIDVRQNRAITGLGWTHLICAAVLWMGLAGSVVGKEARPNFLIFLADDLGWGDLACYGHPIIKTPNLDAFAKQGMRFTQCYSACGVCSPSRSAILTGRTPYRNGVWRWIPENHPTHLRLSENTLPELLKASGYATCHTGKWHLNSYFNDARQPQPNDHGYDWWFATQNNAAPSHKNPTNFVRNGKKVGALEGYSSALVVSEASNWLKKHRDSAKPFFLTVWTHEPHLPIESAPQFMEPYKDLADEGIRQHHGNVTQLDHAFGQMMKTLDELKLTKDTVVIFTSDNGPEGDGLKGRTRGSTGGLRGRKRWSHEGGIRVPGIVRWPEHVAPGSVNETPVIGTDLFPTLLDIAGIPLPADRKLDGASLRAVYDGKPLVRTVPLYWRNHLAPADNHVAMRVGDWKIVGDNSLTKFKLFDLKVDWQEKDDLAATQPAQLAKLKSQLLELHREIEKEGPSEWWLNEPAPTKTPAKAKKK